MTQKKDAKTIIQDTILLINQYLPKQEGHQPDIRALVPQQKINEALILWAVLRMGVDFPSYIERGFDAFLIDLVNHTIANGGNVAKAAQESNFFIPARLGKKRNPVPFEFKQSEGSIYPSILGLLDLYEALDQYDALIARIICIRKKRIRGRAAKIMALQDVLPKGISDKKVEEYLFMKPSDIACSVLVWQYKLPVDREALKKYLALARSPAEAYLRIANKALKRRKDEINKFLRAWSQTPESSQLLDIIANKG